MKQYLLIIWLLTICNSAFSQIKFAAMGDLGGYSLFPNDYGDVEVSNLVKSWDTDTSFFIITLGDNNYFPTSFGQLTIDYNIGQFYHRYIYPYNNPGFAPGYGPNPQTRNRFFRGLGNHDLYGNPVFSDFLYFQFTNVNKGNSNAYPGGVRYYDFQKGNIHFFSYNTGIDPPNHYANTQNSGKEPDGIDSGSVQWQWLKQRMQQSTAKWKIVYFHHPPYYSHDIVNPNYHAVLRFPFKQWGANIVLNAHWHHYERLFIDGLTYVINGLGGATHTDMNSLPQPRAGSQVLYSEAYGSMLCTGYQDSLVFKLINVDNQLIDYFKIVDTSSVYNNRWYVNDNSVTGDIYTSSIGSNSNNGSSLTPFQTINHAISKANAGDTIFVDAGTYGENALVNKRLTIIGSGNTTIINPAAGAGFEYTAGGTRAIQRQELKNVHLTGSGDGVLVSTPNLQYLTFHNIKSDFHTGNGINLNSSWAISNLDDTISRRVDIRVDSCDLSNNANAGLKLASSSNLNGLVISGGKIDSNGVHGFHSEFTGLSDVSDISINGTSFTRNGISATANHGDIIFTGFNGNASISHVNINSDAEYGIKFLSKSTIEAGRNINIENLSFTGSGNNKYGLAFIDYSHLNWLYIDSVIINTNPLPAFTGFAIGLLLDTIGSAVNLSGISFGNTNLGNGAGIDIELRGTSNVNAKNVTFGSANNFTIEDRIHHVIDVPGSGLVTWISDNVYVTTNSFYLPFTATPSIQRAVDAVFNGFTVNVGNGIYNEDININKPIEVRGESIAAIIRGLYAGDSSTVVMSANDAVVRDITVTRDYGTAISEWTASTKYNGINIAPLTTGNVVRHVALAGNHNAIHVNNASFVRIRECIIENNYAGIVFANNFSNAEVHNNFIYNNFTHGILFNYDFVPGVVAANVNITDNSITGNWYSQVNFQRNSAPAPTGDHTGLNFSCNWYGTPVPASVAANAGEPDYATLTPSQFGGIDPGLNRQLYGIEIARAPYIPWLTTGTDSNLVTAGFQPVPDSCNGHLQSRFYVNDSSAIDDIYTTSAGNDSASGSSSSPFATISHAISMTSDDDTIYIDAGTYSENAVVNRRLTIIGSGNTTIVNPPIGAGFEFTAGGTSSEVRQELRNIRLTGSGEGILVRTSDLQYFTFNNVTSDNHTGNGINFDTSWTVSPADIRLDTCDLSNNANAGLRLAPNSNLDSIIITGGRIDSNGVHGFVSDVSNSSNVIINGTSFTGNGTSEIGDHGDIIFLGFNGNTSINNVNINSDAGYGIQFRSDTQTAATGSINLNNVNITGSDKNITALGFINYANLDSVIMNSITINTNPSPTYTGFAIGLLLDTIGSAVNLSGISFGNANLGNGSGIDIELRGTNNVNAANVTFSTANNFTIEDRIHHVIDAPGSGLVTWVDDSLFVTTNSFYLPTTASASIQRGINASSDGFVVNVDTGTYNEDININKPIEVRGESAAAIIRGLYAGDSSTVLMSASNSILKDVTITRDFGATLSEWNASIKYNGVNVAPLTMGIVIQNVILTGNHNAILVNDAQDVTITSSLIENNYAGIVFANNFSNAEVHNNFIYNNFTHGILFNYDLVLGVVAANVNITDNSITGNWYSQVNFQRNSAPAPTGDHTGLNFSCNWYGTPVPASVAANAGEPDYTNLTPSQFGGTDPGLNRQLYGIEIVKSPYMPWLTTGTDNDLVSAGFQPVPDSCNGQLLTRFYVNDSSTAGDRYTGSIGNNFNSGTSSAPFATITHAISVAKMSDTIYVDAGTYIEQVNINKSITIIGNDSVNLHNSIIKAPEILNTVSNVNGTDFRPVIYVSGVGNTVKISHICIDGDGRGGDKFIGVYYFEAGGIFSNSKITRVRDTSYSAVQSGDAFVADHVFNTSLIQSLVVSDNVIDDYQNTGILISGVNTEGIVSNNTITGQNIQQVNSGIGIQFRDGAYGTITGNTITNNLYNGPSSDKASGILLSGVGVDQTNTPTGNITTIGGADSLSNTISGNEVGLLSDSGSFGYVSNQGVVNNGNTFSNNYIHTAEYAPETTPGALNIYDKRVDNTSSANIVYGMIQRAADEAETGDTLIVSAGTFMENVALSESLMIRGAMTGTDARGRVTGAPDPTLESVISPVSGPAVEFFDGSSNTVIDGFVMSGNTGDSNGIVQSATTSLSGIELKNNYLKVTSTAGNVICFNAGITDATIDRNEIIGGTASTQAIFLNGSHSFAGMHLTNNNILGSGGTYGLFVDGDRNVGTSATPRTPLIQGNLFRDFVTGINAGARSMENVQLLENTFKDNSQCGFQGGPKDCNFAGNTFTENGLFGLSLTSFGNTDTLSGAIGTIVQNNFFSNNATAANAFGDILLGQQNDGTQNSNIITNNSFESMIAIYNEEVNGNIDTIHAACNWFSAVTDASVSAKIFNVTGGIVNYSPWLTIGTDNDSTTIGFQPVPGSCNGIPVTDLNIKVIPEGLYNISTQKLNMTDTVRAYLHSNISPYNVLDSAVSTIDSVSFTGSFNFLQMSGTYYIVIKHRNSIETWSDLGGEAFTAGTVMTYDFTDSASKAYQNNMIQVDSSPVSFAIFSGDVNQDGVVDIADGSLIDNDYFNFVTGYVGTDLNADGIVDISDAAIQDNNAISFVGVQKP